LGADLGGAGGVILHRAVPRAWGRSFICSHLIFTASALLHSSASTLLASARKALSAGAADGNVLAQVWLFLAGAVSAWLVRARLITI